MPRFGTDGHHATGIAACNGANLKVGIVGARFELEYNRPK